MNLAVEPTNDIRVRHAIQMAIDVETINDGYWQGTGRTTPEAYTAIDIVGYSPPFDEWPEEIKKFYRYDPAEASQDALLLMLRNHYYVWAGKGAMFIVNQPWLKGYNGEIVLGEAYGPVVARLWLDLDLKKSMGF